MNDLILDERISLVEDPSFLKGAKRAILDDEGTPCKKKFLIENGILRNYFSNLHYSSLNNMESSGNGFKNQYFGGVKDVSSSPDIRTTNLLIPVKDDNPTISEMIKDIKEGMLIDMSFDCTMGDIVSGDLNGNIDLGYRIENGELKGRVKNKRFAANIYELFGEQLVGLSNSLDISMTDSGRYPYIMSKDVSIT